MLNKLKKCAVALAVLIAACCAGYSYLQDNYVMYNTKSGIYHKPTCEWAIKCTVNCIMITKDEAERRGRPCKVCGG